MNVKREEIVAWTAEAEAQLNRVPAGFMREMTREEVERVARAKGAATIDLATSCSCPWFLCFGGMGSGSSRGPWRGQEVRTGGKWYPVDRHDAARASEAVGGTGE